VKIEVGKPPCDGRYVTLVPRENSEYTDFVISDFLRGNWLWRQNVLGWIGPLPGPIAIETLKAAARAAPVEYDL
jgi:hypothetical protein